MQPSRAAQQHQQGASRSGLDVTHSACELCRPFEAGGESSLEFYCQKSDAGVFAFGSHNKKRPNNLILGRVFDGHIYDMNVKNALTPEMPSNLPHSQLEFGVRDYRSITSFGAANTQIKLGNKPMFVFAGEKFENDPEYKMAKSLLLDLFRYNLLFAKWHDLLHLAALHCQCDIKSVGRALIRGMEVSAINLKGLDNVTFVAAAAGGILFRQYAVSLKKSGTKVPR
eukprot:scaffold355101_cov41-Prasinocladus_malaysianus.AAC.1